TRAAPPLSLALRPRAPRPTPFPYTTLFRSAAIEAKQFRSHLQFTNKIMVPIRKYAYSRLGIDILNQTEGAVCFKIESSYGPQVRSEEHTSELQSRENLVCRLLLEKKTRCSH